MRPTLRQLELFAALADATTMSEAAAELHISESALSHAITQLERSFGTKLCLRKKARGVTLTPAGHLVAAASRRMLQQIDDLVSETAAHQGRMIGEVKVGCFDTIASTLVPPLMEQMLQDYPDIRFSITVGPHDELIDKVTQGRLHFAFLYDQSIPTQLAKTKIYPTEEMVLIREDHPLAAQESITFQELEPEPLAILNAPNSLLNTKRLFAQHGVIPNIVAEVPDIDLVHSLVGRGLAYGILMSKPLRREYAFEGHRVVFRPLDPRPQQHRVAAVWSADAALPRRASTAIELTRTWFSSV